MSRLKYDPSVLTLQTIDSSGARQITLCLDKLAAILNAAARVDSLKSVLVRGIDADPGELGDLVERSRMIALAGFSHRELLTTGQGMRRQEAEELLRAFTRIEFRLPHKLNAGLLSFHGAMTEETRVGLEQWLHTIESYARVKQAWQRSAELVVRLPQGNTTVDVGARLDRLSGRASFQVQRSADAAAFTLEQQQAQYGMKLCEEPYRVMTFSATGQLTTCSGDQRQRVYFGSLEEETLRGLWEGTAMESWRRIRTEQQCQGCPGLGTALRRPALIAVYDTIGEQRFHEYPQQQLRRIANDTESHKTVKFRTHREFVRAPRKAS